MAKNSISSEDGLVRSQSFPLEFTINAKTPYLDTKISDLNANDVILVESTTSKDSPETISKNGLSNSTNLTNDRLTLASFWNPFKWIIGPKSETIEDIESQLFKSVRTPVHRYYLPIRNSSLKIWTISTSQAVNKSEETSVSNENVKKTPTPIVLVHGFCGAIGLWIHNIDELSENGNRPFHAFDLLGFGRSSRPLFSADPIVAETQFIESIEDWRREMKLDQMILLGHSFGGYLSAAYAIKYPKRVKALILADPWGFPEKPSNSKPDTPMPLWIRMVAKLSQFVSPLALVRLTGQWGVKIFKNLRPDFRHKFENLLDDPDLIYSYIYYANSLPPSGEYGFRTIADYFGFAKNPMIRRIANVDNSIPIWFIYGGRSWIDHTAGFNSIHIRQNAISTSVKLITGAGHHVYADKPREFNEYVRYIYRLIDDFEKAPTEFFLENENMLISNIIPQSTNNRHHHYHH